MESTLIVAKRYLDALAAGDFEAVAALFTDTVAWHQPGGNQFSGTHVGGAAVNQLLGGQMAFTGGTLEVKPTGAVMVNGALFTLPVHFTAKRGGTEVSMDGVDVFRVEGDRIAEIWLFSADQPTEDSFWDAERSDR